MNLFKNIMLASGVLGLLSISTAQSMSLQYTMDQGAFKSAVQQIADGIAVGAALNLEDIFQLAPNAPILKVLGMLPGPFKKWFAKVAFSKHAAVRVDYDHQTVVLTGAYSIKGANLTGNGTIRFGSDLADHMTAKTKVTPIQRLKIAPADAQAKFDAALKSLANALNMSVAIEVPKTFNILDAAQVAGKIPDIGKDFTEAAQFLNPIKDLFSGSIGVVLGYTSQKYYDPRAGWMDTTGLNVVGKVNFAKKWADKLTQKIMDEIGATISTGQGLWAHVVIPLGFNGLEGEIYLPGQIAICPQMIEGKKCGKKPFLQTERFRIGLKVVSLGTGNTTLNTFLAAGANVYLPWQSAPLKTELKFTLTSASDVQVQANLQDLQLGHYPVTIEDAMILGSLDIGLITGAITTTIKIAFNIIQALANKVVDEVKSQIADAGVEGSEVAAEAAVDSVQAVVGLLLIETVAGFLAVEGADLAEILGEGVFDVVEGVVLEVVEEVAEDLSIITTLVTSVLADITSYIQDNAFSIIMPIDKVGFEGKVEILGRTVDVEGCIVVDEKTGTASPLVKVQLTQALGKDFINLGDILDIFYDLQKKELEGLKKLSGVKGLSELSTIINLVEKVLSLEGDVRKAAQPVLDSIKFDNATLILAPLPGTCGDDLFKFSTIEIQGSGSLLGVPFDGDITLNLALNYLKKLMMLATSFVSPSGVIQGAQTVESILNVALGLDGAEDPTGVIDLVKTVGSVGWNVLKVGSNLLKGVVGIGTKLGGMGATSLQGGLNIGIFVRGQIGKPITVGPVMVSSIDGKTGPQMQLMLGFPTPLAQKVSFSPILDNYLNGKININVPPGFEADFDGELTLGGFEVKADSKLGQFQAHLDAELMLVHLLDSHFKFTLTGGAAAFATGANDMLNNFFKAAQGALSRFQGDVTKLEQLVKKAQDSITSTQSEIDSFNQSLTQCTSGLPGGQLIQTMNNLVDKALSAINPDEVVNMIGQYGSAGYDVNAIKSTLSGSLGSSPLNQIPGIASVLK